MHHPLLYELNTRCWLHELSQRAGWQVTLGKVPATEIERWQRLGFTHVWLMGIWSTGPRSRAHALADENLRQRFSELLPDWQEADVTGSPYAIADYHVPEALGGDRELEQFRQRLHSHGLKLILDFVPNHVGLDHRWLETRPDLFVQSQSEQDGTFLLSTRHGEHWMAHGRDPYFPPWTDTAQLDYRRAETHTAMIEVLQSIARRCDGVRCDMAMLVLKDVFAKTWVNLPCPTPTAMAEFWTEAIHAVKHAHHNFLFIAEAYWDLEPQLQTLGFDFTYDKIIYDDLVQRKYPQVQERLLQSRPQFTRNSVHFLENHDEPRIASLLSYDEHRAAALLTLGIPGLRLLYEGQLQGHIAHVPIHLGRRPLENEQAEITAMYEQLLVTLQKTAAKDGKAVIQTPRPAWEGNHTAQYFTVVQWQTDHHSFDLVVVNLAPHRSQCYVSLTVASLAQHNWVLRDLLGDEVYERRGDDLESLGLYLDLPACGAQIFHAEPL